MRILSGPASPAIFITIPHAAFLGTAIRGYRKRNSDTVMKSALIYILWFCVVPLSCMPHEKMGLIFGLMTGTFATTSNR
jgi:hypothetical protein